MKEDLERAWRTRRDPLITDRRYDIACMLTWFFYAAWGILSLLLSNATAFRNIAELYAELWGGAIGIAAANASAAALTMYLVRPESIRARIRAKRVEAAALCSMLGLMFVYPVTLLFLGGADGQPRWDILALSLSYFPQAVFRIMHLRQRLARLYQYTERDR